MPRLFDREDLIPAGLIELDHCSLSKSEAFKYNAIFVKVILLIKRKSKSDLQVNAILQKNTVETGGKRNLLLLQAIYFR